MLTEREERILKIIVGEFISTAMPVGSENIARKHELRISPATVRNDMASLEEEGYITHPHTSAGRIPSDKGYRYYVEELMEEMELPLSEQRTIRHLFHQVETDMEEWIQLAASILARVVRNLALVTFPKASLSRLKHIELVTIQEFLALLIVVLQEAKLKKQILPLEQAASQEELSTIANKLTAAFESMTSQEIAATRLELPPLEEQIARTLIRILEAEDQHRYEDPYLDGLRHLLSQPEFAQSERMLRVVHILEDKTFSKSLLTQAIAEGTVHVVIGEENAQESLRNFSLVLTRYGVPSEATGIIGVIGPTRMQYGRSISSVRYLGTVMSELVAGLQSG